ncbi:precorrin-3B synthase [Williamsia serinedens]|uniref:Precorrin-3B synthase n=1 Tax=Williamsia serinedens TaxID=391736 RepID=A0ABT1GWG2_9NOCA|nr:precorrin-3B synthase [Williamsia serinedens]MCP2159321.1 precorrin-3B synthase [Williamsia serinedens]
MSRPSDRCPGVLDPHPAADGLVARIRLPGGAVTPTQMQALAAFAAEHGDDHLELTGRANVQVRGLTEVDEDAISGLREAGLLPSGAHDRVRNAMVSPLSGRLGGLGDVRPLAADLDAALVDDFDLAVLPGRFLFGFDDGHGDVLAHRPDVGVLAVDADTVEIVLGGRRTGRLVASTDAVAVLLGVAREFVRLRCDRWRIADLDDTRLTDLVELVDEATHPAQGEPTPVVPHDGPIVGWFDQDDGGVLLGAVVELARIPARTAEFLAAIDHPIVITPDREVLVCDLSDGVAETVVRVLAPMGVIYDASSPWARVSACAGSPGCARSHADVRGDLVEHVASGDTGEREHWIGCERGCGSPHGPHLRVEAGPDGYTRARTGEGPAAGHL